MDEMQLVREFLPESPAPTTTVTQRAQTRLSADISRARRERSRPWRKRWKIVVPALAAAAAAAAGLAALTMTPAAAPHGNEKAAVLLADHAAAAADGWPVLRPGQWLYQKVVAQKPDGSPLQTGASWIQVGTGAMAAHGGDAAGFSSAYGIPDQDLGKLPADPHALIRYLAALAGPGQSADEGAFLMIQGTLIDSTPPPAVAVKLYRALGDIPGVIVDSNATDVAGRHGVAFARDKSEIILSKGSYRFMGFVTFEPRSHRILDGEAILQRVTVSGPFVLPPVTSGGRTQ